MNQPEETSRDVEPPYHRDPTSGLQVSLRIGSPGSKKVNFGESLAAFAIRVGLSCATLDTDFRRFEAAGLDLISLSEKP